MRGIQPARAFTLVELLVVITIIGILIALLLPAVQVAREAARIAQCQNNIKQLALGCLDHESVIKRFPTGGWGFEWTGDPDRGTDWRQPGGWIYNILPYVEQQPLHDLGMQTAPDSAAKLDAGTQRISSPIGYLNCPTRRRAITYPFFWYAGVGTNLNVPSGSHTTAARCDYAMNGGEYWTYAHWKTAVQNVFAGPHPAVSNGGYTYVDGSPADVQKMRTDFGFAPFGYDPWPQGILGPAKANGVSFAVSMVRANDVTDGLTNTYLLGEKNMDPLHYTDGCQGGDDEFALQGFDTDNYRFACDYRNCRDNNAKPCTVYTVSGKPLEGPAPDTPGFEYGLSFGGAHLAGFNMALCDGSVRTVSYSIDPATHSRLCNRQDGQIVDFKKAF